MKQRFLSSFLFLTLLINSCGIVGEASGETTSTADTTAADETEAVEETIEIPDYKLDLKGEDFTVVYFDPVKQWKWNSSTPNDIDASETNGEILNDAVYKRNLAVEEMYNLEFASIPVETSASSQIRNSIMAADGAYDAILLPQQSLGSMMSNGIYGNL